ncbi:efflux RND transporter periplasmic adaptor subunit [Brachyspira hyodysenteriae]|uniref:efflux RND transporter periplasmic adaptor subunit n=1 Tax=Brachyspira hyodysenteriae TaxID=159 RepID=UPI00063DB12C|nr:efflux RND transporter periplasmic adaptor subunit [Brachyspira hyodysenteriae]KLI32868.1 membrane protein [Brachyspira hyodysenteriae]KLI36750.1 membrane protein [Brachyspira hyodysenteriae]MCZ9889860.1 efflux RND transporter periplasmic adaptor subunit [Brachyspira hyodysenteriae]MCZ9892588.1 efflux RND transporter periplasmic adaptor subunit [Brachyspira hyodysenteriae]MCZ9939470.1 efflux RND transporter periplasmic adaptor subunit [Brachyspira hyodysenteriae]
MMRRVSIIILSFVLILSVLSISCKKAAVDLKKKENPISVLVAAPIKQPLEEYLDLSAEIKAIKEVEISSDVPGKIANILKYEGSFVNKGDTIALIDRFVIGANYAYAPARTPISGYVTTTYMAVGASIAASTPIANVADISQLEVEIQVPERSIAGIELGQKVIIRVPSAPNKEIEATITKRDYAVNPSTRTLMVKALIDNKERLLLPGMFSDVSILLNSADNVFVIPNSAMFSDDLGKNYIYVVKEDTSNNPPSEVKAANSTNAQYRAYTREVNVLFTSKDKVALSGGLEEGEEVVMFGREFLKNGSLVNRIENDPTILEYITPPTAVASADTNIINNTASAKPATTKPAANTNTTVKNNTTTQKPAAVAKPTTTKPAATVRNNTPAAEKPNTTTTVEKPKEPETNTSNNDTIYSVGG